MRPAPELRHGSLVRPASLVRGRSRIRGGAGPRPRRLVLRAGAGTALVGVAVLAWCAVLWLRARPAANVGTATVKALAAVPPAPGPVAMPVPVLPGTLPTAPDAVVAPVALTVPVLGLRAPVVPEGVDAAGQVVVPPRVDTLGWYRFGPGLDAPDGTVVVDGHVDSAAEGPGAFFGLRTLRPGDLVRVTGSDGRTTTFRVVAREEYAKTAIDLGRYITWSGARRLTLITCGGAFDRATRHYADNVVVTAVPVPDGPAGITPIGGTPE